jgi:hypothetical protein
MHARQGGSLDSWLHKHAATADVIALVKFALGAARGIAHLHAEGTYDGCHSVVDTFAVT